MVALNCVIIPGEAPQWTLLLLLIYQGLTQEAEPVEGTYIKGFITRNWLL